MKLWDLLPDFMIAIEAQLLEDEKKYGEKWKELSREGQEQRIYERFHSYYYNFVSKKVPIPWLKIAGLCLIGWTRDKYASATAPKEEK